MSDTPAAPPGKPNAGLTTAKGKLFIQTHGCQMNEYDSAKMADVLAEHEGLAAHVHGLSPSSSRGSQIWPFTAAAATL